MLTKKDANKILETLVVSLHEAKLDSEVDFLAYGSVFGQWRNGLSDIDGIMFFHSHSPIDSAIESKIKAWQKTIMRLYLENPNIKTGFLSDVFVFDYFHSTDGRFVFPLDADWVKVFWRHTQYKFVHGEPFIGLVKTVSLRNQNELELAVGLQKLRNYLLFELPRSPKTMSLSYAKEVLKFFKVIPRTSTIILGLPMARYLQELNETLWEHFKDIDFTPLIWMSMETATYSGTVNFLKSWHTEPGRRMFVECLRCYEQVLKSLVLYAPMLSR